jgi:hypothetical protein
MRPKPQSYATLFHRVRPHIDVLSSLPLGTPNKGVASPSCDPANACDRAANLILPRIVTCIILIASGSLNFILRIVYFSQHSTKVDVVQIPNPDWRESVDHPTSTGYLRAQRLRASKQPVNNPGARNLNIRQ